MEKGKKEIPYYILEILLEHSDEKHPISCPEIRYYCVQQYGKTFERRTLYSAVKMLNELGYDIKYVPGLENGYYIADSGRPFNEEEVKMLIRAINISDITSEKQKQAIIMKLFGTLSKYQERKLRKKLDIMQISAK